MKKDNYTRYTVALDHMYEKLDQLMQSGILSDRKIYMFAAAARGTETGASFFHEVSTVCHQLRQNHTPSRTVLTPLDVYGSP